MAESGGPDPQANESPDRLAVCASTLLVHSLWWSRLELNQHSFKRRIYSPVGSPMPSCSYGGRQRSRSPNPSGPKRFPSVAGHLSGLSSNWRRAAVPTRRPSAGSCLFSKQHRHACPVYSPFWRKTEVLILKPFWVPSAFEAAPGSRPVHLPYL